MALSGSSAHPGHEQRAVHRPAKCLWSLQPHAGNHRGRLIISVRHRTGQPLAAGTAPVAASHLRVGPLSSRNNPGGVFAARSGGARTIEDSSGGLVWPTTEVPGTKVAQLEYQSRRWPHPRRLVLIRHREREDEGRVDRRLLDVPGYRFQALVTSLSASTHPPLAVRYYHGQADCENVIKELQSGFAWPALCPEKFRASEAALSLATLTYNLTVLFQRHLGWQQKVTIHSLRFWRFITTGGASRPQGKTTIKLAVPKQKRNWWHRLWKKILSPFANGNAVENQPAFTS